MGTKERDRPAENKTRVQKSRKLFKFPAKTVEGDRTHFSPEARTGAAAKARSKLARRIVTVGRSERFAVFRPRFLRHAVCQGAVGRLRSSSEQVVSHVPRRRRCQENRIRLF